jgi:hypothetical protein
MSNQIIRAALETKLNTLATANAIPVAWENRVYVPVDGLTYLRSFFLPGETQSGDLGRLHRKYVGVYQVSIVAGIAVGPGGAENVATLLAAAFPPATPIVRSGVTIYVIRPMSASVAIVEPDRYIIPCSLSYEANTY